jgi:serine/threonine protein kinase
MANNTVKIGDFGISKVILTSKTKASCAGTPMFLAPEQLLNQDYDTKADIWQVGCAIYWMACLEPPF